MCFSALFKNCLDRSSFSFSSSPSACSLADDCDSPINFTSGVNCADGLAAVSRRTTFHVALMICF